MELDGLLHALIAEDGSQSDEEREKAALALGQLGAAAVEPLAAILAKGNADARWWAARALAEVGGSQAVPPLLRALKDVEPDVRACAALALGQLGDGVAAPALASTLADESAYVASIASDALSMMGEPAIDALAQCLVQDNVHVRLLAARALSRIRSHRAIEPLLSLLEDPSYLVRYYVQEALEALGVGLVLLQP